MNDTLSDTLQTIVHENRDRIVKSISNEIIADIVLCACENMQNGMLIEDNIQLILTKLNKPML